MKKTLTLLALTTFATQFHVFAGSSVSNTTTTTASSSSPVQSYAEQVQAAITKAETPKTQPKTTVENAQIQAALNVKTNEAVVCLIKATVGSNSGYIRFHTQQHFSGFIYSNSGIPAEAVDCGNYDKMFALVENTKNAVYEYDVSIHNVQKTMTADITKIDENTICFSRTMKAAA